jgi:hypothetical protein
MRNQRLLSLGWPAVLGGLFTLMVCLSFNARAIATGADLTPAATLAAPPMPDAKRLYALGMIETGNDDGEVGGAGEISRYQIHPTVWKVYSNSRDYRNPDVALQVARLHWSYLAAYFKEKTGREANDFDMYVLWNTKYGYYAHKGFSPQHISPVVQERAQRFVNLVNRKDYASR